MTLSPSTLQEAQKLAEPSEGRDLKALLRQSVILAALENIMKLDECPVLRAAARARYLDLTDGRLPQ